MTERSCALCVKRHEVPALGRAAARIECRAIPPLQGLARDATYPVVTAAHYCHNDFASDPVAAAARDAAKKAAAELDDKARQTAEAAAAHPNLTEKQIAALDRVPEDGVSKPGGSPKGGNRKRAPKA